MGLVFENFDVFCVGVWGSGLFLVLYFFEFGLDGKKSVLVVWIVGKKGW